MVNAAAFQFNVFPVHLESIRCVPAQKPDAKVAFGSIDSESVMV